LTAPRGARSFSNTGDLSDPEVSDRTLPSPPRFCLLRFRWWPYGLPGASEAGCGCCDTPNTPLKGVGGHAPQPRCDMIERVSFVTPCHACHTSQIRSSSTLIIPLSRRPSQARFQVVRNPDTLPGNATRQSSRHVSSSIPLRLISSDAPLPLTRVFRTSNASFSYFPSFGCLTTSLIAPVSRGSITQVVISDPSASSPMTVCARRKRYFLPSSPFSSCRQGRYGIFPRLPASSVQ